MSNEFEIKNGIKFPDGTTQKTNSILNAKDYGLIRTDLAYRAKITNISGSSSPWTVTISELARVDGLAYFYSISALTKAGAGNGTLGAGYSECRVNTIVNSSTITVTVTGGAGPSLGYIYNVESTSSSLAAINANTESTLQLVAANTDTAIFYPAGEYIGANNIYNVYNYQNALFGKLVGGSAKYPVTRGDPVLWVHKFSNASRDYNSPTGTITSRSGSGPWTGTITNLNTTNNLIPGLVITATNDTGSLGTGGTYTIASIVSSPIPTITFTATGGTAPILGNIINVQTLDKNMESGAGYFGVSKVDGSAPFYALTVLGSHDGGESPTNTPVGSGAIALHSRVRAMVNNGAEYAAWFYANAGRNVKPKYFHGLELDGNCDCGGDRTTRLGYGGYSMMITMGAGVDYDNANNSMSIGLNLCSGQGTKDYAGFYTGIEMDSNCCVNALGIYTNGECMKLVNPTSATSNNSYGGIRFAYKTYRATFSVYGIVSNIGGSGTTWTGRITNVVKVPGLENGPVFPTLANGKLIEATTLVDGEGGAQGDGSLGIGGKTVITSFDTSNSANIIINFTTTGYLPPVAGRVNEIRIMDNIYPQPFNYALRTDESTFRYNNVLLMAPYQNLRWGMANNGPYITGSITAALGTEIRVSNTLNIASGGVLRIANSTVVGSRKPGWNAPTGTLTRGTFTSTANTLVTAQTLCALITDLRAHGLINT